MSEQYTPGPWKIKRSAHGHPYQIMADGNWQVTRWGGISQPKSDGGEANARLIAAAPDLLAACEMFVYWSNPEGPRPLCRSTVDELIGQAKSAIAKAKGEA